MTRILACLAILASANLLHPAPALAAQSYDNCTGFITSLPATITTPGYWCLDRDLTTAIASGNAITVSANNVTIDCNYFRIGGLQAGTGTSTHGISAVSRVNTTVRNCNLRGFYRGIYFLFGDGHLVEGNRFDGNTRSAMYVRVNGATVRNNIIVDTGGSTYQTEFAAAISVESGTSVMDNTIRNVWSVGTNANAYGIYTFANTGGNVIGNRVGGLQSTGTGIASGIYISGSGSVVRDNTLIRENISTSPVSAGSVGIFCTSHRVTARDNVLLGFETAIQSCHSASNTVNPNYN